MLLTIIILTMASYSSASITISRITPSDGIVAIRKTGNITITCQYEVNSLPDFKLQRNGETVVHIQYSTSDHKYEKIQTTKGFDCSLPTGNAGNIVCWKATPKCNDIANYTCVTPEESSSPKRFKAISTPRTITIYNRTREYNMLYTVFRCVVFVVPPSPQNLTIIWTLFGPNINNVTKYDYPVVPAPKTCFSRVTSIYSYSEDTNDQYLRTIACQTPYGLVDSKVSKVMFTQRRNPKEME
ncbi:uncharacterized protein LOC128250267 isoform X2 [Octopus bimaculoides]|nr:uncharacterized protein LOC128250267 isoform X2 [Octopus bimaculoides]